MQTLYYKENHIHPIFNEFDALYKELSQRTKQNSLIEKSYGTAFMPLVQVFKENGFNGDFKFVNRKYEKLSLPKRDKSIIICFSGGKDSTATALYYKKLGYRVILYHLKGINKMYKDEYLAAQEVAEKLGVQFVLDDDIKISGWVYPHWFEHPMKNMILANKAIEWAIKNNVYPRIAFGNFATSSLDDDPFDVCGGDCKEMWEIYSSIMRKIIPNFRVHTPLINMQQTLDILFKHLDIIEYIQSCITPYNYKVRLRKINAVKYNYALPKNRCGSCWKCAVEYIVFCDKEIFEYDEMYYKHCLDVLRNTIKKEQGIALFSIQDVWESYIFYDMKASKFFANGGGEKYGII